MQEMTLPTLRLVDPQAAQAPGRRELLSSLALLVASGLAQTKAALGRATGLPRSSISGQVEDLLRRGVLEQAGVLAADRGRPAERLVISPGLGLVLVADVGAAHVTLAIGDMNMTLLGTRSQRLDLRDYSPEGHLEWIASKLWEMSRELAPQRNLALCVLGLPARIDTRLGQPVRPPIMPGWDTFDAPAVLAEHLGCPVVIENDVNLRALGEAAALPADQRPILTVKIGTGIGAGFVDATGRIYHGYDGSAGEIGHTPLSQGPRARCRCGKTGCVEAIAAVPGMLARLNAVTTSHEDATTVEDLIALLRSGDEAALQVVRESGRAMGEIVATLCNALNPRRVIIGGLVTHASDDVLANVRTTVYELARPLATRNLVIGHSALGQLAGVAGGMVLATQSALSPQYLFSRHW